MPAEIEISRFIAKFAVEGVEAPALVRSTPILPGYRRCMETLKRNLMAQPVRHLWLPVASSQDYPA
jgi:hypothetical protein